MTPETAAPASQAGMRRSNLGLVLGTIAEHGPLSRAAVAARTGLTRAAVSSLVEELRTAGLLDEAGPAAPSGRVGRPGTALEVSGEGPAGLGLEVGVEHVAACVIDLRGRVRAWERMSAANRGRDVREVLPELVAVAERAVAAAGAEGLRPVGAAVAVPGLIAPEQPPAAPGAEPGLPTARDGDVPEPGGVVEHAPNLGWHRAPVAALLRALLPPDLATLPLLVENEANLGALAELWAGEGPADFVHVSAEAGIGAALVAEGRLFRGARGFAGELGHVPVHPEGPACACGARGCLEQYAGEAAVLRAAGLGPEELGGADRVGQLARRAAGGDAPVRAALERAGTALGTALAGAVNLVDPEAVVLGGAYAELAAWLLPGLRAELSARVTVRPWSADAVAASRLGRRGPLLGAALVTVRRIIEDPAALWADA